MNQPEEGVRRKRIPWIFIAALVPYIILSASFWFVTDDAFISFRYARNLSDGEGLRFNPGEDPPVEGFSNFLWTAVMAGFEALDIDPSRAAPWVSFLLGGALLWLLHRMLRDEVSRAAALLGLLCVSLSPAYVVWSTGGLETMLFAFLLFLAYRLLQGDRCVAAGGVAGLMTLTRPEGLLWAIGLAVLFMVQHRKAWRKAVLFLSCTLALFLPYLLFRWAYFGYPLANTLYAKSTLSLMTLHRGFNYTAAYLVGTVAPPVLLLLSPLVMKRNRPAVLICFAFVAYSIVSGGDFMAMGRFLAPSAPFFAIVAALLVDRFNRRAVLVPAAVLVLLQLLPLLEPHPIKALHFRWNSKEPVTEMAQWRLMKRNVENWILLGKALKRHTQPGDSYVAVAIGAVGYFSDRMIYDRCGLVDLEVAHRSMEGVPKYSAGHDKMVDPEFFLPRKPTVLRAVVIQGRGRQRLKQTMKRLLPSGYEVQTLPLEVKNHFLVMQRRIE
jgi:hypothetical protein